MSPTPLNGGLEVVMRQEMATLRQETEATLTVLREQTRRTLAGQVEETAATVSALREEMTTTLTALTDQVTRLVHNALPLTTELQAGVVDLVTEWQSKKGDGGWHNVTGQQAVDMHRQGRAVRQRQVTPWEEVPRAPQEESK